MSQNETLSMYENIAGLTDKMVDSAQEGDWDALATLETRCAIEAARHPAGAAALEGEARLRKLDLLKRIMANDRAIRDFTQPWMGRLQRLMRGR